MEWRWTFSRLQSQYPLNLYALSGLNLEDLLKGLEVYWCTYWADCAVRARTPPTNPQVLISLPQFKLLAVIFRSDHHRVRRRLFPTLTSI